MGEGPGAIVSLRSGDDVFLARITRRSVQHLGLAIGKKCHAVIKSVSVSPTEIG
jgi:molybdate transport system ATP-binding protein